MDIDSLSPAQQEQLRSHFTPKSLHPSWGAGIGDGMPSLEHLVSQILAQGGQQPAEQSMSRSPKGLGALAMSTGRFGADNPSAVSQTIESVLQKYARGGRVRGYAEGGDIAAWESDDNNGSGGSSCVAVTSLMPDGRTAGEVKVGDTLVLADEQTLEAGEDEVTYSEPFNTAEGYRVTTANGAVLLCSDTAPLPTRDDGLLQSKDVLHKHVGTRITTGDATLVTWDQVVNVEPVGELRVQYITVNNKCFWAGESAGKYILHHNMIKTGGDGARQDFTAPEPIAPIGESAPDIQRLPETVSSIETQPSFLDNISSWTQDHGVSSQIPIGWSTSGVTFTPGGAGDHTAETGDGKGALAGLGADFANAGGQIWDGVSSLLPANVNGMINRLGSAAINTGIGALIPGAGPVMALGSMIAGQSPGGAAMNAINPNKPNPGPAMPVTPASYDGVSYANPSDNSATTNIPYQNHYGFMDGNVPGQNFSFDQLSGVDYAPDISGPQPSQIPGGTNLGTVNVTGQRETVPAPTPASGALPPVTVVGQREPTPSPINADVPGAPVITGPQPSQIPAPVPAPTPTGAVPIPTPAPAPGGAVLPDPADPIVKAPTPTPTSTGLTRGNHRLVTYAPNIVPGLSGAQMAAGENGGGYNGDPNVVKVQDIQNGQTSNPFHASYDFSNHPLNQAPSPAPSAQAATNSGAAPGGFAGVQAPTTVAPTPAPAPMPANLQSQNASYDAMQSRVADMQKVAKYLGLSSINTGLDGTIGNTGMTLDQLLAQAKSQGYAEGGPVRGALASAFQ